jgi:AcrR family transcriptional regulator
MSPSRDDATSRRRRAILDAALECFSTVGYDQTTLADIRQRAGASTGSIYHHFGSKEQIAGSLYLDAIRATQDHGIAALLRTRTGRTGIHAQVHSYLDWVEANPDRARFLLWMRHAEFVVPGEPEIDALNAQVQRRAQEWFARRIADGELPDVDPSIRRALVFGPCRHWASRWLAGDTTLTVAQAKRQLAPAAHAALMALMP